MTPNVTGAVTPFRKRCLLFRPLAVGVLPALSIGCASLFTGPPQTEPVTRAPVPAALLAAQPAAAGPSKSAAATPGVITASAKQEAPAAAKPKITLPMAIELCVKNNFRVLAGGERIRMAEADLITSSLIPNPSLFADCQLIPLQHVDVQNQLGPVQYDALVTIPIDWLVFGKRLAAMQAARLGIDMSHSDAANVLRVQLSQMIDAFYEVLMDEEYFKLYEKTLDELKEVEKLVGELAKAKKVGELEVDRAKLAVHEAILERHDRELALDLAKAKLRPFLGRTAADGDYEVVGSLDVSATVPPPKLDEALALAELHRPDLALGRKAVDQAGALAELERRRARPQIAIQPGFSYYDQRYINGYRNGPMFDIGVSTTLPITDRNQGNIRRAQAAMAERQLTYLGDRGDALAEVEASVASYSDAVEHLTLFNDNETLTAAKNLRKNMEAAFRAGDRRLIELLDAEKAYRDRIGHVIEFQSDYWRTLNRLNASVGLKVYDADKVKTEPLGGAPKKN
jgi:cobalt-zinc-cadmium efflux system outer membrane protein